MLHEVNVVPLAETMGSEWVQNVDSRAWVPPRQRISDQKYFTISHTGDINYHFNAIDCNCLKNAIVQL